MDPLWLHLWIHFESIMIPSWSQHESIRNSLIIHYKTAMNPLWIHVWNRNRHVIRNRNMHININRNRNNTINSVLAAIIPSVGPRSRTSYREISRQEFLPEGFPAVRSRNRISFREISQVLAAGFPAMRSRGFSKQITRQDLLPWESQVLAAGFPVAWNPRISRGRISFR